MELGDPIDHFDRKLLSLIQTDNRKSQSELGRIVNLSSSAVNRRLLRFEENGTIVGNVAIVAPKKVGRPTTVIVGVSIENEKLALLDEMKRSFLEMEEVQQCYYVTGDFDFILVLTVKNMEEYEQITRRVLFSDMNVRAFRTFVVMDPVKASLFVPVR